MYYTYSVGNYSVRRLNDNLYTVETTSNRQWKGNTKTLNEAKALATYCQKWYG